MRLALALGRTAARLLGMGSIRQWGPKTWGAVAFGIAAVAVAVPTVGAKALVRNRVEEARYEVLTEHEGFEVRRYAPRIVAEVVVEGSGKDATNRGFKLLADFIFGNNTRRSEIAMTAPVDRTASERIAMTAPVGRTADGERWVVAFTMPSDYTMQTLPRPNDDRVRIRAVPAARYAAMRFSGAPSEERVARRMLELDGAVRRAGLKSADKPATYARFDPPWTPSFLRRNEILLELADER